MSGVANHTIEIEIPPRPDYVSLVRVVVAAAAELDPSLEPPRVDDLRVAVSEATTNAIQAHIRSDCIRRVRVSCQRSGGQVSVVVSDEGSGFDADALLQATPSDTPVRLGRESGMGISIMRALADESSIDSGPHGTDVHLRFEQP
ncbi:MAG: ATP-binding protein [Acidimicrobiaceae bacterium]|nr:ATP-binding protein [Acidimicrobiaceae bacterium]MYK73519.1 ATP-binding protein [Acidimicrobiaceae bacterium]